MPAYELKDPAISGISMGGECKPRLDENGRAKLSPDGRATLSTSVVVARPLGGIDRGITIAVIEPATFPLGTVVSVDGRAWLTPYVQENGGRANAGRSIVCERLIAVLPTGGRPPGKSD